jgi:hypothetical protein
MRFVRLDAGNPNKMHGWFFFMMESVVSLAALVPSSALKERLS